MIEISKAITAVMTEINGVAKSMTVGSGNSSYKGVSDKDVRLLIRESMIKNGLSILPTDVQSKIQVDRWEQEDFYKGESQGVKSKQSIFTEVNTKYILLHSSGESIELAGYGQGVDSQDKGAGKATTYALKNTLLNMFLIPTGVDTDDTHSDDLPTPPKKSYPKEEENDKPWMNDPELKRLEENIANFEDADEAVKIARQKYKVSKVMEQNIRNLF